MKLIIVNETSNPLGYLNGAITIPGPSGTSFDVANKSQQIELATDGKLRDDLIKNLATLSDGVNSFSSTDALLYLTKIAVDSIASITTISDTINNVSQSVTLYFDLASSVTVNVSNTWSGTLSVKASLDGVNFNTSVGLFPVPSGNVTTAIITNGTWVIPAGGYRAIQITSTAWTSGSADIVMNASLGSNSNAGTNTANQGAPNIYENAWPVVLGQKLDGNNTVTITDANASPGNPWIGAWTQTRSVGFVRELILLASNVTSGLGGIFTFDFSEDGITVAATNVRPIEDFTSVKDFDLLNTGEYFRIKFEPDRIMTPSEFVFIRTTLRRQNDGAFARLLNQELEEQNASLPHQASFIKAFDPITGKSVNIRPTPDEALKVADQTNFQTPSGSQFTESIRDDISHKFSSGKMDYEVVRLISLSTTGSSQLVKDYTEGQLVFDTGSTPNSIISYGSKKIIRYETGHGVRVDQSIEIKDPITGDALVLWGVTADDFSSGAGTGIDSGGIFHWRKKNGVFEYKQYQNNWNRDKCDGNYPSLFKTNGIPTPLNINKNNLYNLQYTWLGADVYSWFIKSPADASPLKVNVNEYPNNNNGSSIPDPELRVFVYVKNDSISGDQIRVATGSWRGGIYSSNSVQLARNPNDDYIDIRSQGLHDDNSTTTPLPGNSGGSDHIWRGKWFAWNDSYGKLVSNVRSDVAGTLYIDYSEDVQPIDDIDTNIHASDMVPYDPTEESAIEHRATPVLSRWVRLRYINGLAAQSEFQVDAIFTVNDPGLVHQELHVLPSLDEIAGIVRAVPALKTPDGTAYQEWPIANDGNPKTYVSHVEDDILIEPLGNGLATQIVVGTTPTRIDPTQIANRRAIRFSNEGAAKVAWGHSSSITFNSASIRMKKNRTEHVLANNNLQFWAVAEDTGGVQTVLTRLASSASGTATNPSNVLTSNDVYANITANAQTISTSGYTAGTTNPLVSVKIGIEGNKQSGTTETVAFQDVITGNSASSGTVSTSANVTAATNHLYLAAISRESSITINTITGLGLTWNKIAQQNSDDNNRAVDVWYAQGTPSGNGIVTASFASTTSGAHISVSRYSNVSTSAPIQDFLGNNASNSTPTSGPVNVTDKGEVFMAAVIDNATSFTPAGGYTTVSSEFSADSLGVLRKDITSTGIDTPSATLNANKHWGAITVSLTPATGVNPVVTLSYTLSAVPGTTSENITFTSSSDTDHMVDVTADRSWVYTDIPNVNVIATGQIISAAAANIDTIYLEITDTTGNTARISVWQGGQAVN